MKNKSIVQKRRKTEIYAPNRVKTAENGRRFASDERNEFTKMSELNPCFRLWVRGVFSLLPGKDDCLKKSLTEKEKLFCSYYAGFGDARGCAARAGYCISPAKSAEKLLARTDIRAEIERLEKERRPYSSQAEKGLYRLAFGSVADALKLLLCEETMSAEEIEKLDLFNVSDIKRPKGGGMEIKFIDRLKALEKLAALGGGAENTESSFIRALSEGARLLSEEEDN